MLAALARPERVARLCVVDIAPVHYPMGGNAGILAALRAVYRAVPKDVHRREQKRLAAHLALVLRALAELARARGRLLVISAGSGDGNHRRRRRRTRLRCRVLLRSECIALATASRVVPRRGGGLARSLGPLGLRVDPQGCCRDRCVALAAGRGGRCRGFALD